MVWIQLAFVKSLLMSSCEHDTEPDNFLKVNSGMFRCIVWWKFTIIRAIILMMKTAPVKRL
jgi:hypothetical protein